MKAQEKAYLECVINHMDTQLIASFNDKHDAWIKSYRAEFGRSPHCSDCKKATGFAPLASLGSAIVPLCIAKLTDPSNCGFDIFLYDAIQIKRLTSRNPDPYRGLQGDASMLAQRWFEDQREKCERSIQYPTMKFSGLIAPECCELLLEPTQLKVMVSGVISIQEDASSMLI